MCEANPRSAKIGGFPVALRRPSAMKTRGSRKYATPASRAIWRAILTKKHKDLSPKQDEDIGWKEEFEAKMSPSAHDITKRHIIILVEEMEQAYQYFELKDFLLAQEVLQMKHCVPEESIDAIVDFIEADARFQKLDTDNIRHALMLVDWDLQLHHTAPSDIINETIFNFNDEMITTTNESEPVQLLDDEELFQKPQLQSDSYLNAKPVFGLVYETLKMNHVLHQKPEEELKILKKKMHPCCYYNNFISEERKYKEKTVTFAYDGCDVSQEDIKILLSDVGEILSVHSSRLEEQLHMAHVTFKDLTTANGAIRLAAQGELKLNERPVWAVLTSHNKPTSDMPAPTFQLQYTEAAMSALEKVEDELLADAHKRYAIFVEKANQRKMDNKRKRERRMDNKRKRDSVESGSPDDMQFG